MTQDGDSACVRTSPAQPTESGMREKLAKMSEIVQENLERAQATQKKWYDRTARTRGFMPGDKVLVLLPTSTNKLRAQWQGRYEIVQKNGEANYVVDMDDKRKRLRTFHVNMLRGWHESKPLSLFTSDSDESDVDDVIVWDDGGSFTPTINPELDREHHADVKHLLADFSDVI